MHFSLIIKEDVSLNTDNTCSLGLIIYDDNQYANN